MKSNQRRISWLCSCITVLLLIACVDSFQIPAIKSELGLLVVDGFINAGGPTTCILTRTMNVDETGAAGPELKASVRVEGENHTSQIISEAGKGIYTSTVTIDPQVKYRIYIKTYSGEEYRSGFVEVKETPPIDEIVWEKQEVDKSGLKIYVSAHDPQKKTIYYRWNYVETWYYHSDSPRNQPYYQCWKTEISSTLLQATSIKLDDDVISRKLITTIPANAWKLDILYSMLLKQYAITPEAYAYWENLRKNTEALGGLTDPQPAYYAGNIYCVNDPYERVLGYVSASNVAEKRIYIDHANLPLWFYYPREDCTVRQPPPSCFDCRYKGGSIVRPDFWPY